MYKWGWPTSCCPTIKRASRCGRAEVRDDLGLKGRLELEASGGVRLEDVGEIAATGVDRISVGALTHLAVALDIALEI